MTWLGIRSLRLSRLKVFPLAHKLAMEILNESKAFPKEERFSLTDQTRHSSRSVAANITEGFRLLKLTLVFNVHIDNKHSPEAACPHPFLK
jgi:hypothetical protein